MPSKLLVREGVDVPEVGKYPPDGEYMKMITVHV